MIGYEQQQQQQLTRTNDAGITISVRQRQFWIFLMSHYVYRLNVA